jgi:oxygen-independent coproporphyrinogen-3 oxidase
LLALVLHWHPLAAAHEFSIEANPGDLDEPTVAMLAEHGVTRVSLGAQSFNVPKLRKLERDHSARDILRSVQLVRSQGMQVALDLIFAAPEETLLDWESDLRAAVELRPQHLSTYGLNIERGTSFWARWNRGEAVALHEEMERSMYEAAIDILAIAASSTMRFPISRGRECGAGTMKATGWVRNTSLPGQGPPGISTEYVL